MRAFENKEEFLEITRSSVKNLDEGMVMRAWDVARHAHQGQQRTTNEPYFSHPVAVAKILLEDMDCDSSTIAAALLHDVVEDTGTTLDTIARTFGATVASLVDGVTKLRALDAPPDEVWGKEKVRIESLRKLFVSIAIDPRVALIKLADRLHNLRTLKALPNDKRRRIAQESLDVFAPLAEALGLVRFQERMQELAFSSIAPETYDYLRTLDQVRRKELEDVRQFAVELLEIALDEASIEGMVLNRYKSLYSIHRKMIERGLDFDEVYDTIGLRIIVGTESDCYRTLQVVDRLFTGLRLDDYISNPRGVFGYQSLHKVVQDVEGNLIEIQIRTEEMHQHAERGTAAHWVYKMGIKDKEPDLLNLIHALQERLEALSSVLENMADDTSGELSYDDFVSMLRDEGLAPRIHVYTPKRDVISLPKGATPIDFAYHIHSELGNECVGARINNKQRPLDTILENGDVVEVVRRKGSEPSWDWLIQRKVRSSRAKQKIQAYFRSKKHDEWLFYGARLCHDSVARARELGIDIPEMLSNLLGSGILRSTSLDQLYLSVAEGRVELEKVNRVIGSIVVARYLQKHSVPKPTLDRLVGYRRAYNVPWPESRDSLYLSIFDGSLSTDELESWIIEIANEQPVNILISDTRTKRSSDPADGFRLAHRRARCCWPIPGDPIVGYMTISHTEYEARHELVIHRDTCVSLPPSHATRTVSGINWEVLGVSPTGMFSSELGIMLTRADTIIYKELQETLGKQGSVIRSMKEIGFSDRALVQVVMLIDVHNVDHLDRVLRAIQQVRGVASAKRSPEH